MSRGHLVVGGEDQHLHRLHRQPPAQNRHAHTQRLHNSPLLIGWAQISNPRLIGQLICHDNNLNNSTILYYMVCYFTCTLKIPKPMKKKKIIYLNFCMNIFMIPVIFYSLPGSGSVKYVSGSEILVLRIGGGSQLWCSQAGLQHHPADGHYGARLLRQLWLSGHQAYSCFSSLFIEVPTFSLI